MGRAMSGDASILALTLRISTYTLTFTTNEAPTHPPSGNRYCTGVTAATRERGNGFL